MTKVAITKSLLDGLANSIAIKSGETLPLTIAAMKDAVDDMTLPSGSVNISSNGSHNVTAYETAVVAVPESTFIVTLSFDNAQLIFVPDKTFAELSAAYQAGKDIIAKSDETSVIGVGIERDTLAASLTFFVSVSWATGPQTAFTDYYYWNSNGYTLNRRTSYSIPQGTKTIVANGTGIDVAEYAAVDVAVPQLDTSDANATASDIRSGKSGYVDGVKVPGNQPTRDSTDVTVSDDTVTIPAGIYDQAVSKSVAAGSEGTPSAVKGAVSNNSVQVTPKVTNGGGFIAGGVEKTGTPVTVTAAELVSGKKEITANGDDIDVTNFEKVKVAVSGGKNVQYVMGSASVRTNGYTSTGMSITVAKAGTYKVSWVGWRSSSQGTMGTNLYKNGTAGTNQQTFTSTYGQAITLNNQSLNAGDVLTLYATAGSTSRYMYVANLIIEEQ